VSLLKKIILAIGLATLAYLLWKMDPRSVLALLRRVGWGFGFILLQEVVPHGFNAAAWAFSYPSRSSRRASFGRLFLYRVVGDGVNYLTPSATIAGEFARAALIEPEQPMGALGAVVIAKCAQSLAQLLFIVLGLAVFLRGKIAFLAPLEGLILACAWAICGGLALLAAWELLRGRPAQAPPPISSAHPRAMAAALRDFFLAHPGRLAAAVFFFMLGYAWSGVEVLLGCHFLGLTIAWRTAMGVEVLSNVIDALLFMVPAKVGTQEAGKTAIFSMLGLPAKAGLAFGVVRHLRELTWAGTGLMLYYKALGQKRAAAAKGREAVQA